MKQLLLIAAFLFLSHFFLCSCQQKSVVEKPQKESSVPVNAPIFSSDSAYVYIQNQVDVGPRVPNSAAHKACAQYLSSELRRFGAEVIEQRASLIAYNGVVLDAVNIIGTYNPEEQTRVLLMAHWDTRPYSDNDINEANHKKPVLGADDGASGVGVLLEIARLFALQKPEIGVDIVFFDAEDYGQPYFDEGVEKNDTWCLGSQYWARNPHVNNYQAKYGVLLDMVGARGAVFPKEKISMIYAAHIVEKVWETAKKLGYGNYFVNKIGNPITDDHLYVNEIARIPSIDIIHYTDEGFGAHWHTVDDTMKNIDKNTLKAVGETLVAVIYAEKR